MNSSNNNGLKPKKTKSSFDRKRVMAFLDRQGFYIVLLLCLGIIGLTTYLALSGDAAEPPVVEAPTPTQQEQAVQQDLYGGLNEQATAEPTPEAIAPSPTEAAALEEAEPTEEPAVEPEPKEAAAEQTSSEGAAVEQAVTMEIPVDGEIALPFSDTELVYSETLKQWTTHLGVDITAKEGTEVKAAMAGTVANVYKDTMLGNVTVLEHDKDLRTVYAGLQQASELKQGDKVKAGQAIGKVGNTAGGEIALGAHLHFEVWKQDKTVNPGEYVSALNKQAAQSAPPEESIPEGS